MVKNEIIEPVIVKIIRLITGIVFIFSSVVKGIDPLGTDYRVIDYLDVYGWYFMIDFSFVLVVLLISIEFLLGFALLFKLRVKLASLGVLLIMIFFTTVTYFDAKYNLVPDCGCFGDAIKLTNWQTFYKNIVLIIFALVIFFMRNKISTKLKKWMQIVILILFLFGFDWFMSYNYNHLPIIDFRDWKVGNDMKSTGRKTVHTYLIYKNKNTGETKEFISPDYPWNDSTWMSQWKFVSQRVDDSQLILKHGVIIEDDNGNIITDDIFENPGYQLILISNELQNAEGQGMIDAAELFKALNKSKVDVAMLTSSTKDEINRYREVYIMDYNVYFADDTELKAMIRSNPGMILMHNGIVVAKWHYNDFPTAANVKQLITQ